MSGKSAVQLLAAALLRCHMAAVPRIVTRVADRVIVGELRISPETACHRELCQPKSSTLTAPSPVSLILAG